jgi:hypothetical protein
MLLKKFAGTALAVIMLSSPAFAAEISPEGGKSLQTLIQNQIDLRKNIQSAAGGQYVTEGDLKVEPADGYYAVTFPHVKLKDAEGKIYDIGMIAANVIPGDTAQEWKAAIAIPTPIRIISAENRQVGQVDLGKQRAIGVWDMDVGSFTRLDAKYDDITFKSNEDSSNFKAETLAFQTRMNREANGNLSGPASAIVTNWNLASPEDDMAASIKELRIDATVKDFDPKVAKSFNEQISAIGQVGQTIVTDESSLRHDITLYNMITDVIGKSSDAAGFNVALTGLKVAAPDDATQAIETFELGNAGVNFDISGFRSGSVKTGVRINYNDLKLNNATDPYKDIVPLSADLNLIVDNLPFSQLVELGRTTVSAGEGEDGAGQAAAMGALMTVPKLLTDAGTTLTQSFDFTSNSYKGKGSGVVTANMKAVNGYTADQDVELQGLDKVIEKINEEIKKPGNPDAQNLQSALGTLTILQMVGQKKPDNPDIRTYKLIVDEQGRTMLNGSDMSTLLGGVTGVPAGGGGEAASSPTE